MGYTGKVTYQLIGVRIGKNGARKIEDYDQNQLYHYTVLHRKTQDDDKGLRFTSNEVCNFGEYNTFLAKKIVSLLNGDEDYRIALKVFEQYSRKYHRDRELAPAFVDYLNDKLDE